MPLSRPNAATPVARTRKRRMTKLPWKRPPVVLADRITVGKRDPPDCALAPAGAASSASETRAAAMAMCRRFMAGSPRIWSREVAAPVAPAFDDSRVAGDGHDGPWVRRDCRPRVNWHGVGAKSQHTRLDLSHPARQPAAHASNPPPGGGTGAVAGRRDPGRGAPRLARSRRCRPRERGGWGAPAG